MLVFASDGVWLNGPCPWQDTTEEGAAQDYTMGTSTVLEKLFAD